MRLKNRLVILALIFAALSSHAKGGGKVYVVTDLEEKWFHAEGFTFGVFEEGSDEPLCSMVTDKRGVAKSPKLPPGNYVVKNTVATMGYRLSDDEPVTIEKGNVAIYVDVLKNSLNDKTNEYFSVGPNKGDVTLTYSAKISQKGLAVIESSRLLGFCCVHEREWDDSFTPDFSMVYSPSFKKYTARAPKDFLKHRMKSYLVGNALSLSLIGMIDYFRLYSIDKNEDKGYYLGHKNGKAALSGSMALSDKECEFLKNGRWSLKSFWEYSYFYGGATFILEESGNNWVFTEDFSGENGFGCATNIKINRKSGKIKAVITSKNALGVNIRHFPATR